MDMPAHTEALLSLSLLAVLCLLCGSLALIDLRRGIIPDGINLAIAALGVSRVVVTGGVMPGAEAIIEAMAVGIAVLARKWRLVSEAGSRTRIGIVDESRQPPLHAVLQVAGQGDFQDLRFDLHLQLSGAGPVVVALENDDILAGAHLDGADEVLIRALIML